MRSRIFTPVNATPLADTALKLRNAATPFGLGALVSAIFAAASNPLTVAIHSSGIVEVVDQELQQSSVDLESMFSMISAPLIISGQGDGRSKILESASSTYAVGSDHLEAGTPAAIISDVVCKPVAPSYTILSVS